MEILRDIPGEFKELCQVDFEDMTLGRKAAIMSKGGYVVRSTDRYEKPMIEAELPNGFNNAMIELYTDEYRSMKYHSDMALDLAEGSKIAIYSCYPEEEKNRRKLIVKDKVSGCRKEFVLENRSMIKFSLETNRECVHKIVGRGVWLGITYRKSKTIGTFRRATEEEKKELYKLRTKENREVDFKWPEIEYQI